MTPDPALAARRFGLGEAHVSTLGGDPVAWLAAQIGPGDPPAGSGLPTVGEALQAHRDFLRARRKPIDEAASESANRAAGAMDAMDAMKADPMRSTEQAFVDRFKALVEADLRSRCVTAATTRRPFAERLVRFWSNHFTVSNAKAGARGLSGAFEREAIRPRIAGRFAEMLKASTRHAGMLRYLDNVESAGPHSRVVERLARRSRAGGDKPRITGLNENLGREVMELHTLGAESARAGIYTQADVTALAAVLTGWRIDQREVGGQADPVRFDPAWHEPGPKTVLGRRIPEGEGGLDLVLDDLARHPACIRHLCTKLARSFVADDPPPALVDRMVAAWTAGDGDLPRVYRALIEDPLAWNSRAAKLMSPDDWVIAIVRTLDLGARAFERAPDSGIAALGQRIYGSPSPAGWPDRAEEWLGPDAVWKRVEYATRVAERMHGLDARRIAEEALGSGLREATRTEIARAADGSQALAMLLLSPEFQRR